jgi:hypothetical protein
MAIKRMNYYKGEFLHAEDFQCEQDFHSSLRKIHNLTLHTSGIVKGLDVIAGTGEVTVKAGVAIDIKGRELILESDQKVTVSSSTDITIFYNEVDDPETDEGGFKGVKQKTVTCKVIAGTAPDGVAIAKVTNVGANPVTLDLSNRKYSAPVANGDVIVGGNLEVKGNLTVQGETTVVKTKRMRGNVELGDEDTDIVTLKGILRTGHSSGKLKINSSVDMTGTLSITGSLTLPANGLLVGGNQLALSSGNVGIGTIDPKAKLHISGNAGILNLEGTDHAYIQWFPQGLANGRKAWVGFGGAGTSALTIQNDAGRMHIHGTELLYLLNKDGVIIGKEWGGNGNLTVQGSLYAGNSDIYFTKTDHNHTGIGNTAGYAAIENAANYNALMILGRTTGGTPNRVVKLWDYLEVNGTLKTDLLLLGNKWRLSGVGDHEFNDEWLRLKNIQNNAYYGGFAASKFWTSVGQYQQSDIRLKKDITPIEKALGKVLSMRGVAFRWTDPKQLKQVGMIAQEVEAVIPEVVESGPDGFKGINYSGLIGLLIEAIKEQQSQIAQLQKKLIPSMA